MRLVYAIDLYATALSRNAHIADSNHQATACSFASVQHYPDAVIEYYATFEIGQCHMVAKTAT